MNKMPKLEINCIPSQLNTSQPNGVASQLASVAQNAPNFDNVTVTQMRGNALYDGVARDQIDIIGRAQKALADAAHIVKSRAKYIRALNNDAANLQKLTSARK